MAQSHNYYVYIVGSKSGTLYTGMTNNLERRIQEHKEKTRKGFTARYNVNRLVFYEHFTNVNDAIAWEKRIKGWTRAKKIALIESKNPKWTDLSEEWTQQQSGCVGRDSSLRSE